MIRLAGEERKKFDRRGTSTTMSLFYVPQLQGEDRDDSDLVGCGEVRTASL
jgi:hypothetical protein